MNTTKKEILKPASVVTIGVFDGVHTGHKKIIAQLIATAKQDQLNAVVLTFFPHPRMVLQKANDVKLINTIAERKHILKSLGIHNLVVKKFTKSFSELSAETFIKRYLVAALNVKKVIIGYDHRFGKNRSANINDLKTYGLKYGFEVIEIPAQDIDAVAISSTKIRTALNEGNIIKANRYLGYPFSLTGKVISGKALGRIINFPTANLHIEETYKLIPQHGVYVVKSKIHNKIVFGMMNIGLNPTVSGTMQTIEIHYFNFKKDLYNATLKVEVLQRLRDEIKFDSLDALKNQLKRDQESAMLYIERQL